MDRRTELAAALSMIAQDIGLPMGDRLAVIDELDALGVLPAKIRTQRIDLGPLDDGAVDLLRELAAEVIGRRWW